MSRYSPRYLASPVIPTDTTGIVEAIRQLRVASESAVKSSCVALVQLGNLSRTAPADCANTRDAQVIQARRLGAEAHPQACLPARASIDNRGWPALPGYA